MQDRPARSPRPVRAKNLVRAAVLGGATLIAAAALIRPFRDEAPAGRAIPGAPPRAQVTPEGLVAVDAEALFARIRQSPSKGVVINAWASWCGSCKEDMPLLLGLKKTFGGAIDVMLVSVDEPESQGAAQEMLLGFHAPEPHFVVEGSLAAFKAAMDPRWPGMLPASFLFDTHGTRHYFWGGPVHEDEIVPLLRRYLAGEHVDGKANFGLAPGATGP